MNPKHQDSSSREAPNIKFQEVLRTKTSSRGFMDPVSLTQSPFAVLTFIAAPALLTNSSSVLALSTINRMLANAG